MLAKCENRVRVLPSSPEGDGQGYCAPNIAERSVSHALPFLNTVHDNAREG